MFYIQVVQKHWDKPESPTNKIPRASKSSEAKGTNSENSKFAKAKVSEYKRKIQQDYYLKRRLFC
jgi:hypothetical protein